MFHNGVKYSVRKPSIVLREARQLQRNIEVIYNRQMKLARTSRVYYGRWRQIIYVTSIDRLELLKLNSRIDFLNNTTILFEVHLHVHTVRRVRKVSRTFFDADFITITTDCYKP